MTSPTPQTTGNNLAAKQGVTLVLPYPPAMNHAWKTRYSGKGKGTYLSEEYKLFKAETAARCAEHGMIGTLQSVLFPAPQAIGVRIDIYRPQRTGDLDGRIKPLLDALNGLLWTDDKQIKKIVAELHESKNNGSATITAFAINAGIGTPQMLEELK